MSKLLAFVVLQIRVRSVHCKELWHLALIWKVYYVPRYRWRFTSVAYWNPSALYGNAWRHNVLCAKLPSCDAQLRDLIESWPGLAIVIPGIVRYSHDCENHLLSTRIFVSCRFVFPFSFRFVWLCLLFLMIIYFPFVGVQLVIFE